jgi:hypothetical protein
MSSVFYLFSASLPYNILYIDGLVIMHYVIFTLP